MIAAALLLASVPGVHWAHGPQHAERLKRAGIAPVAAAEVAGRMRLLAPGVTGDAEAAGATRAPWVVANGWLFLRRPQRKYYYDLPAGPAALAAAEAYAYGMDAVLGIQPADIEACGRMLAFLRALGPDPGPALAQVGIVDDGSAVTGEVINLLVRRNLLPRVVAAPDPALPLNIQIGSQDYPRAEAVDPSAFALKIRRQIGDSNRLLRLYGSEMVLARLAGDQARARLHLVNYGGDKVEGLRVRLRGRWASAVARGSGYDRLALDDFQAGDGAVEFTIPEMQTYAVVDLTASSPWPAAGGAKALVLLFLGVDCPLSNRYAPELARLHADYSGRGAAVYAVHSDTAVTAEQAKRHAAEYGLPFPTLLDPQQTLARQAGATATPEAVVVSPAGQVLYRGRIDDRVVDFGKTRQQPVRQDLRRALEEILTDQPVSQPQTKAVGCAIPFTRPATGGRVTFTRDVAPILYRRCAPCHHEGGAGPVPLLSFADAARRASLIAAVTASRFMPPWKPQPGYGAFRGARRLPATEIAALEEWAAAGAPEGDPALLPPAPPKRSDAWQLGAPDLVAQLPQPFPVAAGGPDVYQCFVLPLGLSTDRYVRAVEFQPGNRKLVHHALLFADPSGAARRRDAASPELGYGCFGAPGFLPARGLGGWTPGSGPIELPAEAPLALAKGSDLVLQIHLHPTGKPEEEQSRVALYFSDTKPSKRLVDIPLASNRIDIPPGERAYVVRDHFTVPIAVDAVGIIPHAHFLCKEMKGVAVLPGGKRQWLLWIRDWDFNWQEQYRYAKPVRLPAGTRLEMEFTYDNSAENPRNPNHPPQRVLWGPGINDEMAGLHVQVLPVEMSEMPELGEALRGKMMRMAGGGFFRLTSESPPAAPPDRPPSR